MFSTYSIVYLATANMTLDWQRFLSQMNWSCYLWAIFFSFLCFFPLSKDFLARTTRDTCSWHEPGWTHWAYWAFTTRATAHTGAPLGSSWTGFPEGLIWEFGLVLGDLESCKRWGLAFEELLWRSEDSSVIRYLRSDLMYKAEGLNRSPSYNW